MAGFDEIAPVLLAGVGVPFGSGDLDVLRVVAAAFEPAMLALDGADLAELPLEPDLDPGRPPS